MMHQSRNERLALCKYISYMISAQDAKVLVENVFPIHNCQLTIYANLNIPIHSAAVKDISKNK